jgi:diguanylate cyclase (GGDEF)-like protein
MLSVPAAKDIDAITAALHEILQGRVPPKINVLSGCPENEIIRLTEHVNALMVQYRIYSEFVLALSRGDLSYKAAKGTMHHSLKNLQANLRHFMWKMQQIAQGDLTQQVDFMGEFSAAFNSMVGTLQHQALHDALTDLPNRRLLADRLSHALAVAKREVHKVALLYVDLDGFKLVNDSLGHTIGDALLQQVSSRFRRRVRESDTLARLGGDEFAVVLSHLEDKQGATVVAEKLLETLASPFLIDDHKITIGASVGISLFPDDSTDAMGLLQQADSAMYDAKRNGKNGLRYYTPELGSEVRERMKLESQLRGAMDRGELCVHYQPEFDVISHRLIRFEALARWAHPTLGMIPPAKFIPIAEESGLIVALGAYVMERACSDAVQWQALTPYPIQVAVNVSSIQFSRDDFVEEVICILNRTGLKPSLLQIELTESVMLNGSNTAAAEMMKHLSSLGVSLAIDDFGTGYSCLSYLPRLPFNALKIDRSFVKELDVRPETRAMVNSLIALAHELGMRVIAEGVETPEQLELIKELGGNEVQGYLLGRPTADPESQLSLLLGNPNPYAVEGHAADYAPVPYPHGRCP